MRTLDQVEAFQTIQASLSDLWLLSGVQQRVDEHPEGHLCCMKVHDWLFMSTLMVNADLQQREWLRISR